MAGNDIARVAAQALGCIDTVLAHLLPDGKREGSEYKACNPTRSDHNPGSFSVNINTGAWADFATGDKGGDVISLAAYLFNLTQGQAKDHLANMLGVHHV